MISKRDVQLGKIALQEDMVSKEQVNKCLKIKKKLDTKASLGAILVKKGYITKEQLEIVVGLLNEQTKKKKRSKPSKSDDKSDSEVETEAETEDGDEGKDEAEKEVKKPKRRRKTVKKVKADEDSEASDDEVTPPKSKKSKRKSKKAEDGEAEDTDEADDEKGKRSAVRRRRRAKRKKDEEEAVVEPSPESSDDEDEDEDISAVLQSDDDIIDPSILQSAEAPEEPVQDQSDMMAALLASTLEQSEEDPEESGQVSDSMFESADMTDSGATVDKRSGKVKRKVLACKECSKKYRVKPKQAGKRFKCRKCKARVSVPEDFFAGFDDDAITEYTGGKSKSDAEPAVDEFDLDDLDDEDEEVDTSKKRRVFSTKKIDKKKILDDDEKPSKKSYRDLVEDALDAPDAPMPVRRMTTANYIQLVFSVVVLVSTIGGYVAYSQWQESERLRKAAEAEASEWKDFETAVKPIIEQARESLAKAKKTAESDKVDQLSITADDALTKERYLENVFKQKEILVLGRNPSKSDKFLEVEKFAELRQNLRLQAAKNLVRTNSVALLARASDVLNETVQENEKNVGALVLLSRIFARNNQWEQAFSACQRALNANGESVEALMLRGHINELSGSFKEAIKSYKLAQEKDPFALILVARVQGYSAPAEAIKTVDEGLTAIENNPVLAAVALIMKARAQLKEKKQDAAIASLKEAQEKNAEFPWPSIELAKILVASGRAGDAIQILKPLISKGGAAVLLALGRAQVASGDFVAAERSFLDATIVPSTAYTLGPELKGIRVLDESTDHISPMSNAKVELSKILLRRIALNSLDLEVTKNTIESPNRTADLRDEMQAKIKKLEGLVEADLADVRLNLVKAVEIDPWNLVAISRYARYIAKYEDKNQAAKLLQRFEYLTYGGRDSEISVGEKARVESYGNEEYFLALSIVSQQRGELNTAEKSILFLLECQKDNSEYLLRHAHVLQLRNQREEAAKRFKAAAKIEAANESLKAFAAELSETEAVDLDELQELRNRVDAFIIAHPMSGDALKTKAEVFIRQKLLWHAKLTYDEAAKLNPYNFSLTINYCQFLMTRAGGLKYRVVAEKLRKVKRLSQLNTTEINYTLASAYFSVGKNKEALLVLNDLLLNDSGYKPGYLLRSNVHAALGDKRSSERDKKRANK